MNLKIKFAGLALLLIAAAGCGGNGLPIVDVEGKVTFDGGECPSDGRILFKPIELNEGLPNRVGTAHFKTDGQFDVTTFDAGDGLMPGRYRVEITCISGLPDFSKPDPLGAVSYIKAGYQPEELVVEAGKSLKLTYDLPKR